MKEIRIVRRPCLDVRGKVAENADYPNGWLEGYLAVFGNVDAYGERILKGAFAKSVVERVSAGKVPLMVRHMAHGGDVEDVIGHVVQAQEDEFGLAIRAAFDSTTKAQETRRSIIDGSVWGLSVGYQLMRWTETVVGDTSIVDLLECKLLEGTVTVRPANESAVITGAKSVEPFAIGDINWDRLSREELEGIQAKIRTVLVPNTPSASTFDVGAIGKAMLKQKHMLHLLEL